MLGFRVLGGSQEKGSQAQGHQLIERGTEERHEADLALQSC
jgi:hypothetical protein